MLKSAVDLTVQEFKGLNTKHNILGLTKDQSPNMMNVEIGPGGEINKRLGTNTQNAVIIAETAAAGFTPVATGTLTNNLQAFWALDESSGNRADNFGGHLLLDNNSVGFGSGIRDRAASFVASDSEYLLHVNTSTLATGDVDFSISTWIFLNSTSTTLQRMILSKADSGNLTDDTVLLLHFDGLDGTTAITDNSIHVKTLTARNSAEIDTEQSKFGGASLLLAAGSSSYVDTPDHVDWFLGASNFTIDMHVRFSDTSTATQTFIGQSESDAPVNDRSFVFRKITANTQGVSFVYSTAGIDVQVLTRAFTFQQNQWYHVAVTRASTSLRIFVDGSVQGDPFNVGTDSFFDSTSELEIGSVDGGGDNFRGWIDELRMIKGRAAWVSNFTVPTLAYNHNSEDEYRLYVNSDNVVTFDVSSSGVARNGQVRATSFGAITTSTWYNLVAWHDTGNTIGISVNLSADTASYSSGVRSGSAPFVLGAISSGASSFFDGRIDETGFWKKVLTASERSDLYNSGNANSYQTAFNNNPWGSFDFGATNIRWLTVAAGTGVYASSNLGVTWVNIATDRTANYQSFERSKGVIIMTSDAYDNVLFWAGSANTFAGLMNNSAPTAKYVVNHQGFLILLNTDVRKLAFYYEDEGTQLTGNWGDIFDLPSTHDDEITAGFVLRNNVYVSTRRSLFRTSFIGGNPDWSFKKIKDWGYVSRTVDFVSFPPPVGQVAMGMTYDRKIRIFDGSDDFILSDPVENNNRQCEFAMSKISYAGSGLVVSHSETDINKNVYKLCVAVGADSTETTHFINYDGRVQGFYPDSNRQFNTMVMAESANQFFLMAFDRSGRCHMMDSGNRDGNTTAIDDVYDSRLIFDKAPSEVHKSYHHDLFFDNNTAGRVQYHDRTDFSETFNLRREFTITGTGGKFIHRETIDVAEGFNTYQYRITSSSGTNDPWLLMRQDLFVKGQGVGRG